MHRLIRSAQIGALALLLVLGAGNVACEKGSSGTSTNVFNASGGDGNSTDGTGGFGNGVNLSIYHGGAGSIEVKSSGSVDASFTPTASFTPELGANPLVVMSDLSIPVVTSAPARDIPYTLEGDSNLYVSDGDMDFGDEAPVTGLQVQAGVTVTLGLNIQGDESPIPETGGLAFSDDVINDGTITVVDVDSEQRGSIDLRTDGNYIGSGRIETFGTTPGQDGGDISAVVFGNGYNSGDWASYGADQTDDDGGDGGDIEFVTVDFEFGEDDVTVLAGGLIENTGRMNSNGGVASGATGFGGDAGEMYILAYLSLWNSGDLDAIGGSGIGGGGWGGDVQIAGYFNGELRNTGDITTVGGDTSEGIAGGGGGIAPEAWGGDLRSSGGMLARGGDSRGEGGVGGYGGDIQFFAGPGGDRLDESELDVPAGDIWVSGGAISRGGDALAPNGSGGVAGYLFLLLGNDITEGTQSINVLGIEGIYAQGGNGGLVGDMAYSFAIDLDLASEDGTATGSVNVEPLMSSSGGDADPAVMGSEGGDAGNIAINAGTISYGSATADGGTGWTPGADGTITPETVAP